MLRLLDIMLSLLYRGSVEELRQGSTEFLPGVGSDEGVGARPKTHYGSQSSTKTDPARPGQGLAMDP